MDRVTVILTVLSAVGGIILALASFLSLRRSIRASGAPPEEEQPAGGEPGKGTIPKIDPDTQAVDVLAGGKEGSDSSSADEPLVPGCEDQSFNGNDVLSQHVYDFNNHLVLLRKYVSRQAYGKGRALLEALGLTRAQINKYYGMYPLNEEESVQDGLQAWIDGEINATWIDLLEAMKTAGISIQQCVKLRKELCSNAGGAHVISNEEKNRTCVTDDFDATVGYPSIVPHIMAEYVEVKEVFVNICTKQGNPTLDEVKDCCIDLIEGVCSHIPRISHHKDRVRKSKTFTELARVVCFHLSSWVSYDFFKKVIAHFQPALKRVEEQLLHYEDQLKLLLQQKLKYTAELQHREDSYEIPGNMAEFAVKYELDADGLQVKDLITKRDFLAQQLGVPKHLLQVLSCRTDSVVITYRIMRDVLPLAELALCRKDVQAELTQHGVEDVYFASHTSEQPGLVDQPPQTVHLQRRAIVTVLDAHREDLDATSLTSDLKGMGILTENQCQKIVSLDDERKHEALLYTLLAHDEPDTYDKLAECVGLRDTSIAADLQATFEVVKKSSGALSVIGSSPAQVPAYGATAVPKVSITPSKEKYRTSLAKQEKVVTDRSSVLQSRHGAEEGSSLLPAEITTSSSCAKEVQKVVEKGKFESLCSLAERFIVTFGHIVTSLITESNLATLKTVALDKIGLQGVPNSPTEEDIINASDAQQLFYLLHIESNWVDISLLEQLVDVSGSKAAATILAEYKEFHKIVIHDTLANLVDPSTNGTCPRPNADSCILQLVFSDRREGMRVHEVLACKEFLCEWFEVQKESIKYISAVIGNNLVVTWLVSRCTGLRIVDQCRSTPVLGALQNMEVLAVRLQYPGQRISVDVDMNVATSKGLEEAVHSGDLKQVKELIQRGMDVNKGHMVDELSHVHSSLLTVAIKEGHKEVALELLAARADLHVKDRDGRTALHWACDKGLEEVVDVLISSGSRVDERDMSGLTPVMLAADLGNTAISLQLVQAGSSCEGLSEDHKSLLFRRACHEAQGDLAAVQALLKGGCSVGILSKEEQEKLLFHACHKGDMLVVKALIAHGCYLSCVSFDGYTPLMAAAQEGHEEVVKKLILAGANSWMQDELGNTALHYAALHNHIQCGILLAEGGASVSVKNKFSQTPLNAAKAEFNEAIKQHITFTARRTVCVIGNAGGGKSTLIAALQTVSNSFLGKNRNRFKRVHDRRQRAAGIEAVFHFSQRYGEVLFFDFAGPTDYHGPHQKFLESVLSKPSMTFLLVVNVTEEEDAILHQLHRWLSPVALMATPASPPQVIIIGSFLDQVKSKGEATAKLTRCIEATRKDLEMLHLAFVGSCFLNCRQPQSRGIDQLCNFLQDVPIPEFRATHTRYSLAWVLSQIRSSITAQAMQLHELSMWVRDNKDNLPQTIPPPEEVCQDLSAAGHALYLPNKEDPFKSWLVLDLPSILHDVYGTLFSQFGVVVNEFGLLHCRHLAKLFQHLDLEMVQQLLISLEFCLPVDPSILKVDLSKLTQSEEASGWLFFPALISAKHPQPTSVGIPQESVCYLCWQLRTVQKHSISARLLQTILLRLAAHFVVKHHLAGGVQQHCYSIWRNGIAWKSKKGVDVTAHITNNRVIHVIGVSVASSDKSCQYMIEVISDILSTVHQLSPNLVANSYIVHQPKMAALLHEDVTTLPHQELFPVTGIQDSIRCNVESSLSLKDRNTGDYTRAAVSDLFGGCTPCLEDIGRINWPQLEPGQTQSPTEPSQPEPSQPDVLSGTVSTCEGYLMLFQTYVSRLSAGKGRAVLEGIGLAPETIQACYGRHPLNEEEAVQAGLIKWVEGHHGYSPTWRVLLDAMAYAGVGQQHCQRLREKLCQKLKRLPVQSSQPQLSTEANHPEVHHEGNGVPTDSQATPSGSRALLDISSTPDMQDVDELVVTAVAANWQRVALRLGVEGCVSEVVLKNHPNDSEGACRDMLLHWLRGERHTGEEERTWSTLLTALNRANFVELERRLRKEHFHKVISS